MLGAALAGIICFALSKPGSDAETGTQTAAATSGDGAPSDGAVDIAATFPSWDPESESLAELAAFVQDVTDPASPNYREPADRIATFDMDGTIICEKAPIYVDYMLLIHRVLDDPTHTAEPDVVEVLEKIRDEAMRGNKNSATAPPSTWPSHTNSRA